MIPTEASLWFLFPRTGGTFRVGAMRKVGQPCNSNVVYSPGEKGWKKTGKFLEYTQVGLSATCMSPRNRMWHKSLQDCALATLALILGTWKSQKVGWSRKRPTDVIVKIWDSPRSCSSSNIGAEMLQMRAYLLEGVVWSVAGITVYPFAESEDGN